MCWSGVLTMRQMEWEGLAVQQRRWNVCCAERGGGGHAGSGQGCAPDWEQQVCMAEVCIAWSSTCPLTHTHNSFLLSAFRTGWKGTFVCEPDKHKAMEMYKAWKAGTKYEPAAHH